MNDSKSLHSFWAFLAGCCPASLVNMDSTRMFTWSELDQVVALAQENERKQVAPRTRVSHASIQAKLLRWLQEGCRGSSSLIMQFRARNPAVCSGIEQGYALRASRSMSKAPGRSGSANSGTRGSLASVATSSASQLHLDCPSSFFLSYFRAARVTTNRGVSRAQGQRPSWPSKCKLNFAAF